jgi:hypothetical protein
LSLKNRGCKIRIQGSWFAGSGIFKSFGGSGVKGLGCRVQGLGCRVQGAGCGVQGAGCGVRGSGFEG